MSNQDSLILTARELAEKEGINVNDCNAEIVYENNHTIVEFYPKNPSQFGGGGRVYFKKENDKYKFLKIEHWQ